MFWSVASKNVIIWKHCIYDMKEILQSVYIFLKVSGNIRICIMWGTISKVYISDTFDGLTYSGQVLYHYHHRQHPPSLLATRTHILRFMNTVINDCSVTSFYPTDTLSQDQVNGTHHGSSSATLVCQWHMICENTSVRYVYNKYRINEGSHRSKFKNQFMILIILTHTWLKIKTYTHTSMYNY